MINISDLVGKPYREDNEPRGQGKYDCWDLAVEVFKREGITLPEDLFTNHILTNIHLITEDKSSVWNDFERCGEDILPSIAVFRPRIDMITHAGVHLGEGKFIHSTSKKGVCIESIDHPLWKNRFYGFYRIKEG